MVSEAMYGMSEDSHLPREGGDGIDSLTKRNYKFLYMCVPKTTNILVGRQQFAISLLQIRAYKSIVGLHAQLACSGLLPLLKVFPAQCKGPS